MRGLLAGWISSATVFAAASLPKPEEVTVMPAFEVASLSSEFQHWIKLRTLHFILYTDAGETEARAALRQMEAGRSATEKFFGRAIPRSAPCILVLPTALSEWKKLESKAKVEWPVAVSTNSGVVASLGVVQYDWQGDNGLNILQGAMATATLPQLGLSGPLWFNRGTGHFFETAELNGNTIVLGKINQRRIQWLTRLGWLGWPNFFAVTAESPEFVRDREITRFDGQCALFMHYLLTEHDPVWRQRLSVWRARFVNGYVPTDADFKTVFGQDAKEWQRTMEAYLAKTEFNGVAYRLSEDELGGAIESLDLRTREMRELFVLVQILNQPTPASGEALEYVLVHGLKTAALRGLLITACLDKGRRPEALAQLREMIAEGTDNTGVYLEAVQLRFGEVVPRITPDARLGTATDELKTWAKRIVELAPHLTEGRELLAWIEALGPECNAKNAAAILELFNHTEAHARKDHIGMAMAVALWRAGDLTNAQTVSEALRRSPIVRPEIHALADDLAARLESAK